MEKYRDKADSMGMLKRLEMERVLARLKESATNPVYAGLSRTS